MTLYEAHEIIPYLMLRTLHRSRQASVQPARRLTSHGLLLLKGTLLRFLPFLIKERVICLAEKLQTNQIVTEKESHKVKIHFKKFIKIYFLNLMLYLLLSKCHRNNKYR